MERRPVDIVWGGTSQRTDKDPMSLIETIQKIFERLENMRFSDPRDSTHDH